MQLNGNLPGPGQLKGSLSTPKVLRGMVSGAASLSGKISNATLQGYSAYDIAVMEGYVGTEEEWLASLKGEDGEDGTPGEKIEVRNNDGVLEWKYESDISWNELIDLTIINDYDLLFDKPSLDGVELSGDRDLSEDYLRNENALTNMEIEALLQ